MTTIASHNYSSIITDHPYRASAIAVTCIVVAVVTALFAAGILTGLDKTVAHAISGATASIALFTSTLFLILKSTKSPLDPFRFSKQFPLFTVTLNKESLDWAIKLLLRDKNYDRKLYNIMVENAKTNPTVLRKLNSAKEREPASDVHLEEQNFILAPLPNDHENLDPMSASAYLQHCLQKNVRVMVSAHESIDAKKGDCDKFWQQAQLDKMNLGSWKLTEIETIYSKNSSAPCIIKTTIEATNSATFERRTITHFYYEGWHDQHSAPNLDLLSELLVHMLILSPDPKIPIAINCHAGRGRTLNIALPYYLLQKITAAKIRGENVSEMQINLPSLIGDIEKQRDLTLRFGPPIANFIGLYRQTLQVARDFIRGMPHVDSSS